MADATVNFGSTDVLDLNSIVGMTGTWTSQEPSADYTQQFNEVMGADGDVDCEGGPYGGTTEQPVTYEYCGSTLGTDLALIKVGEVYNSYVITGISVSTANEDNPSVSFTTHNHDSNAHVAAFSATYTLPAWAVTDLDAISNFGAVDYLALETAAIAAQSSSLDFTCQHNDLNDALGEHFVGANYQGKIECSVDYVGNFAAKPVPANSIALDSYSNGYPNTSNNTCSASGHIFIDRD